MLRPEVREEMPRSQALPRRHRSPDHRRERGDRRDDKELDWLVTLQPDRDLDHPEEEETGEGADGDHPELRTLLLVEQPTVRPEAVAHLLHGLLHPAIPLDGGKAPGLGGTGLTDRRGDRPVERRVGGDRLEEEVCSARGQPATGFARQLAPLKHPGDRRPDRRLRPMGEAGHFLGGELAVVVHRHVALDRAVDERADEAGEPQQAVEEEKLRPLPVEGPEPVGHQRHRSDYRHRCQRHPPGVASSPPSRPADDPVVAEIDRAVARSRVEAPPHRRPDIGRRVAAEPLPIGPQCAAVHPAVLRPLGRTAGGGVVVKGPAEHLPAEPIPVGAGEDQMEVPGGVDLLRRADRFAGDRRQKEEAPILLEHAGGEGRRPALLPGQSPREGAEGRIAPRGAGGGIEIEGLQALPERMGRGPGSNG